MGGVGNQPAGLGYIQGIGKTRRLCQTSGSDAAGSFRDEPGNSRPVVDRCHHRPNIAAADCGAVWVFPWIWLDRIPYTATWEYRCDVFPTAPNYTFYRTSTSFTRPQEFYRRNSRFRLGLQFENIFRFYQRNLYIKPYFSLASASGLRR